MSLDKAIKSGKEKRKPYKGSKSFDNHCRNNNWCPACRENRLIQTTKALLKAKDSEEEYADN